MCIHLSFKYEAATQALNYLASKSGGTLNKLKALKLIYFADRFHLRKYGRPVTGDEYLAMTYGPVASSVKDIAEMSGFLDPKVARYAKHFLKPVNKYAFRSIVAVDTDQLSEDFEAIGFMAPLIVVRRRSDGVKGSLEFQHSPRLYFNWQTHNK